MSPWLGLGVCCGGKSCVPDKRLQGCSQCQQEHNEKTTRSQQATVLSCHLDQKATIVERRSDEYHSDKLINNFMGEIRILLEPLPLPSVGRFC